MKGVLAFFTVWSLAMAILELSKTIKKKCDRQIAPNLKYLGKVVPTTFQNEERFSLFDCFKVSQWLPEKFKQQLQKKMWQTKCAKPQDFWQNYCRHTSKPRTFFVVYCFEVSRCPCSKLAKKNYRKKCDRRNIPDFNFFGKTAAGNLSHKERFSFFGCFEVSGWPYEKLEKWLQKKRWQMKYIKPQDFWQKLSEILETMVTPHLLNFLRDMDKFRIVRLQNRTNYQTSLH